MGDALSLSLASPKFPPFIPMFALLTRGPSLLTLPPRVHLLPLRIERAAEGRNGNRITPGARQSCTERDTGDTSLSLSNPSERAARFFSVQVNRCAHSPRGVPCRGGETKCQTLTHTREKWGAFLSPNRRPIAQVVISARPEEASRNRVSGVG